MLTNKMNLTEFLKWRKQQTPQALFKEYLDEFSELEANPIFKKYMDIVTWRIHNGAEVALFKPRKGTYDQGFADGMRTLLTDFNKIKKRYINRKDKK